MTTHEEYEIISKIGEGSFGTVFSARNKLSKAEVAIKKRGCVTLDQCADAHRLETGILNSINHENVVKIKTSFSAKNSSNQWDLYVVYELADMDLHEYIYRPCDQKMNVDMVRLFTSQILCGLAHLEQKFIVHRDIKPANILIKLQTNTLQICDFGLARRCNTPLGQPPRKPLLGSKSQQVGTDWYHAPEVMVEGCPYKYGVDVWAAGCVLGEMLTGDRVFHRRHGNADELTQIRDCLGYSYEPRNESSILTQEEQNGVKPEEVYAIRPCAVLEGKSLQERFSDVMEPDALDLLVALLTFDPADRISAAQTLNHPFLNVEPTTDSDTCLQ